MKILHIDSSVRGDWSVSKDLSGFFVKKILARFPDAKVDYLDLSENTPDHPTSLFIQANYAPAESRTAEMVDALKASDALVDRLKAADHYVFGIPMYNFSVPSLLKAFIDNIVRINSTFKMNETGIEGLLTDKKVFVINTRGVDFNDAHMTPMDQLKPYLKVVLGFMGIIDINFIDVSPVQFADQEKRNLAIRKAHQQIDETVNNL